MTSGMNGSSTFVIQTVNLAFKLNKVGLASAMAIVLLVFIIIITVIQNVLLNDKRRRHNPMKPKSGSILTETLKYASLIVVARYAPSPGAYLSCLLQERTGILQPARPNHAEQLSLPQNYNDAFTGGLMVQDHEYTLS